MNDENVIPEGKVELDVESVNFLRTTIAAKLTAAGCPESTAFFIGEKLEVTVICLAENVAGAQDRDFLTEMAERSTAQILSVAQEYMADNDVTDDDLIAQEVVKNMSITLEEMSKDEADQMTEQGAEFEVIDHQTRH